MDTVIVNQQDANLHAIAPHQERALTDSSDSVLDDYNALINQLNALQNTMQALGNAVDNQDFQRANSLMQSLIQIDPNTGANSVEEKLRAAEQKLFTKFENSPSDPSIQKFPLLVEGLEDGNVTDVDSVKGILTRFFTDGLDPMIATIQQEMYKPNTDPAKSEALYEGAIRGQFETKGAADTLQGLFGCNVSSATTIQPVISAPVMPSNAKDQGPIVSAVYNLQSEVSGMGFYLTLFLTDLQQKKFSVLDQDAQQLLAGNWVGQIHDAFNQTLQAYNENPNAPELDAYPQLKLVLQASGTGSANSLTAMINHYITDGLTPFLTALEAGVKKPDTDETRYADAELLAQPCLDFMNAAGAALFQLLIPDNY